MGGQESPPSGLFKLQLSPGKYAEGNDPAQCWSLGQVGELVDALSLANAPGSMLCCTSHLRAPVCMQAWMRADICPERCPGLAASLVSHHRRLLLWPGWQVE